MNFIFEKYAYSLINKMQFEFRSGIQMPFQFQTNRQFDTIFTFGSPLKFWSTAQMIYVTESMVKFEQDCLFLFSIMMWIRVLT